MSTFIGYPKIGQYRHVIQGLTSRERFIGLDEAGDPIYDSEKLLPIVTFRGTCKLHGSNAGIGFLDEEIWYQSRTGIITPLKDNMGFAAFMSSNKAVSWLKETNSALRKLHNVSDDEILVIFGEICGGNIQKGVALSELSKRFVIFGIRVVGKERNTEGNYINDRWLSIDDIRNHEIGVYNILDYQTWELPVNLNSPEMVFGKINELVDKVEEECPFAKAFGVSGVGEGIVWSLDFKGSRYSFKTKGGKHSSVKSKKDKPSIDPEKVENVNEFVDYAVTENRLNQAIEQVFTGPRIEPTVKQTGAFLKWIVNDIVTEEIDTLAANNLCAKDVSGAISKKAREWFFEYLDKIVFGDK